MPDNLEYIKSLIDILMSINKNTDALAYCQQITQVFPGDKQYLNLGIKLLLKMNRVEDAISQYQRLINADPFNFELYTNCGKLYFSRNDYDNAYQMFKKSKDIEQKFPDNYRFIGKILMANNRTAIAGSNFKTAAARKIYNHEQYLQNSRRAGGQKADPRDNEKNTLVFLYDCYLNLLKCGENFSDEVKQTEEKLFLKGYLSEQKMKEIRGRYKV